MLGLFARFLSRDVRIRVPFFLKSLSRGTLPAKIGERRAVPGNLVGLLTRPKPGRRPKLEIPSLPYAPGILWLGAEKFGDFAVGLKGTTRRKPIILGLLSLNCSK